MKAPVTRDGAPAAQSAGEAGGQRGSPPDARAAGSTGSIGPSLAALPGPHAGAIPPEYDGYVRALRQRIQERLAYPWRAVRQGLGGTIELELSVDGAGRLAAVTVVGRDGPGVLREAAMRAVRDATPFPFPPGLTARPLMIRLPVVFELR